MSSSTLPDTERPDIIRMAIAYEIVRNTIPLIQIMMDDDEAIKKQLIKATNAYIQILKAVQSAETISEIKLV